MNQFLLHLRASRENLSSMFIYRSCEKHLLQFIQRPYIETTPKSDTSSADQWSDCFRLSRAISYFRIYICFLQPYTVKSFLQQALLYIAREWDIFEQELNRIRDTHGMGQREVMMNAPTNWLSTFCEEEQPGINFNDNRDSGCPPDSKQIAYLHSTVHIRHAVVCFRYISLK